MNWFWSVRACKRTLVSDAYATGVVFFLVVEISSKSLDHFYVQATRQYVVFVRVNNNVIKRINVTESNFPPLSINNNRCRLSPWKPYRSPRIIFPSTCPDACTCVRVSVYVVIGRRRLCTRSVQFGRVVGLLSVYTRALYGHRTHNNAYLYWSAPPSSAAAVSATAIAEASERTQNVNTQKRAQALNTPGEDRKKINKI